MKSVSHCSVSVRLIHLNVRFHVFYIVLYQYAYKIIFRLLSFFEKIERWLMR
jgi:hypothetical protein